jgi:hypothetical protein
MVDLGKAGRSFFLYDTFAGFSPRYSSAADFPKAPQAFSRMNAEFNIPHLYETVRDRFAMKQYVKVIQGVVPEILSDTAPSQIAFLHIDMNSPAPEIGALNVLFHRVSIGGIVVFDDYGWLLHEEQKKVVDHFMAEFGYHVLELPTGQGVVVKH